MSKKNSERKYLLNQDFVHKLIETSLKYSNVKRVDGIVK